MQDVGLELYFSSDRSSSSVAHMTTTNSVYFIFRSTNVRDSTLSGLFLCCCCFHTLRLRLLIPLSCNDLCASFPVPLRVVSSLPLSVLSQLLSYPDRLFCIFFFSFFFPAGVFDLLKNHVGERVLFAHDLDHATKEWREGVLSNYDYIMFLNQRAGRSFNDLTQYPVFPWVITDYSSDTLDLNDPSVYRDLSKPIGALNPKRLKYLRERMHDMPAELCQDQPFLYGSHYSTPGYVLYFLVRVAPEYLLRLQSGKFDDPDRLFHSIESTWTSCFNSPTDVKELIPEFYNAAGDDYFLINKLGLNLGVRQSDGVPVDDVILPPWVPDNDPKKFIEILRDALESEYVSSKLHQWIDLIFGFKQRGEEADKANNIFHRLTYEGAVDIKSITDPDERAVIEAQIREFGQTPKQIFTTPHPQRYTEAAKAFASSSAVDPPAAAGRVAADRVANLATPANSSTIETQETKEPWVDLPVESGDGGHFSHIEHSGGDGGASRDTTEAFNGNDDASNVRGHDSIGSPPIASLDDDILLAIQQETEKATEKKKTSWGSIQELRCDRTLQLNNAHVTSVCMSDTGIALLAGHDDSSLRVYDLKQGLQRRSTTICDLAISACKLTEKGQGDHAVIGSWDNCLYFYSVTYGTVLASVTAHDDAVSCVALRGSRVLSGSWDATVKLWDVRESGLSNRPLIEFLDHDSEVKEVDLSPASLGGNIAVSGTDDGIIFVWDTRSKTQIASIEGPAECVRGLQFSPNGQGM